MQKIINGDLVEVITVGSRILLGMQKIIVPPASGGNGVFLSSLLAGAVIPNNAVLAELQADGGAIRIKLNGNVATLTDGFRLEDTMIRSIDTDLTVVSIASTSASNVNAIVAFFDRV